MPVAEWGTEINAIEIGWTLAFTNYLIPINVICLLPVGLYSYQLFRPFWSITTLIINGVLGIALVGIVLSLMRHLPLVEVSTHNPELLDRVEGIANGLNYSVQLAFVALLGITIYEIIRDGRRIHLLRSES